jgi:hypothetical protein
MTIDNARRSALVGFGVLAVGATGLAAAPSRAATTHCRPLAGRGRLFFLHPICA